MSRIAASKLSSCLGRQVRNGVSRLLLVLALLASGMVAAAPAGKPASIGYRVLQLSSDPYTTARMNARGQVAFHVGPVGARRIVFFDGRRFHELGMPGAGNATLADLNERGQIAFNVERNGISRARFYDGRRVRDLGTLGGPDATAVALNEIGQVAGTSRIAADSAVVHPFRWSRATGMLDLGMAGQGDAVVADINARGEVIGSATFPGGRWPDTHGFFWSRRTGILDMGTIGDFSVAGMMNDAGTAIGYAGSGMLHIVAFRWSLAEGIGDMGTLPNEFSWATHINRAGLVVGASPVVPGSEPHPFLFTPGKGLLDLGVAGADRGAATEVNEHGMVIGYLVWELTQRHGFVWTRETGLVEFGAGSLSLRTSAADVNNHGQVVGAIGERAFIWTRSQGVIDLNTLLADAPAGLVLRWAGAISDSGAILAGAPSGVYLLLPAEGPPRPYPTR